MFAVWISMSLTEFVVVLGVGILVGYFVGKGKDNELS